MLEKHLSFFDTLSGKTMSKIVRPRTDLSFVKRPDAVEFDYSSDVTEKDIESVNRAMMHHSGLSGPELHNKLNDGILVSGEEW